jgi:hypothetical protein
VGCGNRTCLQIRLTSVAAEFMTPGAGDEPCILACCSYHGRAAAEVRRVSAAQAQIAVRAQFLNPTAMIGSTRPKTSSCAIVMSVEALENTVGLTK